MIAVVPCIEKSVMENPGKENVMLTNDQTIADVSMKTMNPTPSRAPIRPLTAAYQAVSSNHQVYTMGEVILSNPVQY